MSKADPGEDKIWSWMAGLQWKDVFMKGNSAGFAIGSPLFIEDENGTMYELFYKYKVSNNITVTPAIFWISNNHNDGNDGDGTWGGVIQTTFKF